MGHTTARRGRSQPAGVARSERGWTSALATSATGTAITTPLGLLDQLTRILSAQPLGDEGQGGEGAHRAADVGQAVRQRRSKAPVSP